MAKAEIRTETEIDAPPTVVWDILTDFDAYREWNPFIPRARVDGQVVEGADIRIRVKPGLVGVPVTAELTAVEPERELQWTGQLPVPGLFGGRHTFELAPTDDGGTHLRHWEQFSGLLVSFLVDNDLEQSYHDLNDALARRANEWSETAH